MTDPDERNSKKCSLSFMKFFDIFGTAMSFKIKDKELFQSVFGGILCCLFYIFCFYYLLVNFLSFAQRENMNVIFTQKILSPNPTLNLTNLKFQFTPALKFDNNTPLFGEMRNLLVEQLNYVQYIGDDKFKKAIKMVPCELSQFFEIEKEPFDLLNLNNYICPSNFTNMTLEGGYTDTDFYYLEYGVYINSTYLNATSDAKQYKYVYDLLNNNIVKATLIYMDSRLNVDEFVNPIGPYLNSYVDYLNVNSVKMINMDFQYYNFTSDSNVLFNSEQITTRMSLDQISSYFININQDRKLLGSDFSKLVKIFLRASPKKTIIRRFYQKLTDFLANTTALLSQILLIFYALVTYINNFKSEEKVINKILKFKDFIKQKNSESEEMKQVVANHLDKRFNIFKEFEITYDEGGEKSQSQNESMLNFSVKRKESNSSKNSNANIISEKSQNKEILILPKIPIPYGKIRQHSKTFEVVNYSAYPIRTENKEMILTLKQNSGDGFEVISSPNHQMIPFPGSYTSRERDEGHSPALNCITSNKETIQDISSNREEISKEIKPILQRKRTLNTRRSNFFKKKGNTIMHLQENDQKNVSKNKRPIYFNIFEILLRLCFKKQHRTLHLKDTLFEVSLKKLNYYMDVFTCIKKMQEIDILKHLIFSKDQLNLFNFVSKPSISLATGEEREQILNSLEKTYYSYHLTRDQVGGLVKSYTNVCNNSNKSEIVKKLLSLYNFEVNQLFD
jgi:hypothetical protein